MREVELGYAKAYLGRLVVEALTGEDIVIFEAGTPLVRLVPVPVLRQRKFGLDQGKILIWEGFDEPIWRARMSKVESLKQEILKLSPQELAEFRTWFLEHDVELWDRQIEEDVRAGRLDRLAK